MNNAFVRLLVLSAGAWLFMESGASSGLGVPIVLALAGSTLLQVWCGMETLAAVGSASKKIKEQAAELLAEFKAGR